ncbi:hypothetical protein, partial [Photobacterium sp. R1]
LEFEGLSNLSPAFLSASLYARQTLFVGSKSAQKAPLCSLVLAGTVVAAPGADNLKIRPEFSPVRRKLGFKTRYWTTVI